tara:strand:+ start:239 stop:1396 length:1158 start_codon:yes stop_codon:yes gene_type:complete
MDFNNKKNSQNKDRVKGIFYLGTGDFVGGGIVAIFWLFIASLISVEDYGQLHYFIGIAGIAYVLTLIGTRNTMIVYVAKKIEAYSTLSTISIIFGIITALIVFLIFYRLDVSLLLLAFVINDICLGYILGKKYFQTYSKYLLIQKTLTATLGISFFFLFGVEGILYGIALSYIHFFIIFSKIIKTSKFNLNHLQGRYGFILNNLGISIVGGFKANIDKILIAPLLGLTLLGNYALALQFYVLLTLLPMTISKIFLPYDASGIDDKKLKLYTLFLAVGISISSFIFSPYIIPIFFEKFSDVVIGIQILSIGVIPSIASTLLSSKLLGSEKSKHVILGLVCFISVLVVGIVVFGVDFGIVGITISYVIGLSANSLYLFLATRRLQNE